MEKIKHFFLLREQDASGVSGTGIVARGVVLPSGKAVLEWSTFHTSIALYNNIDDVEAIHGHGGMTKIVMGDPVVKKSKKKANE
jgi:hypothetical protein